MVLLCSPGWPGTYYRRLDSNSERSSCLCIPSARVKVKACATNSGWISITRMLIFNKNFNLTTARHLLTVPLNSDSSSVLALQEPEAALRESESGEQRLWCPHCLLPMWTYAKTRFPVHVSFLVPSRDHRASSEHRMEEDQTHSNYFHLQVKLESTVNSIQGAEQKWTYGNKDLG